MNPHGLLYNGKIWEGDYGNWVNPTIVQSTCSFLKCRQDLLHFCLLFLVLFLSFARTLRSSPEVLARLWRNCGSCSPWQHQGHWRIYDLGNDHGGMVNSRKGALPTMALCWSVRWKKTVDVPCWNLRVFMFGIRWVMSGWLADLVTYL